MVKVTYDQMKAINSQKHDWKVSLDGVLSHRKEKQYQNAYACINDMTLEQIVLAWHDHVEVEPKEVGFFEAMRCLKDGYAVKFNDSNWFTNTYDLEDSSIASWTEWKELLDGKWQVKK